MIDTTNEWEERAIDQLRKRFLENDDHWVAIFDGGQLPQILYEDRREWYIHLILTEGYGQ